MATDKKINYDVQGGIKNYLGKQKMVKAPLQWQSGPKHPKTELAYITKKEKDLILKKDLHNSLKGGVNRGPSGIMSLNGWGDRPGTTAPGQKSGPETGKSFGDQEKVGRSVSTTVGSPHGNRTVTSRTKTVSPKDHFEQSWSGPKGWFGGGGYRDLNVPGDTSKGHKSRFGMGNLITGALSIFGGIPGKLMSVLSRINPGKLRGWNEQYGRYNTQDEYEQARTNRRNQKNIERILNRKAPITEMTYKNLARYGMNPEDMPAVGSTPTSRAIDQDYESGMNVNEGPFAKSHLQSIDLSKYDKTPNTNIISDYPNYRTPNLGGTYQFNNTIGYENALGDNWASGTGIDNVRSTDELNTYVGGGKDGGRAGYAFGEEVTDESMMEATPAGMMQENVEEVQGEPTREELEALAIEIFQLPLEELNEEQLMVVYQAAMQQEPMEEAVQEEDVQFAAQGGLAGLL